MTHQVMDNAGQILDAHADIDSAGIFFHSRGGSLAKRAVNADYGEALRLLLQRLATSEIPFKRAWVDSIDAQAIPISKRIVLRRNELAGDSGSAFTLLSRRARAVGQKKKQKGGNSTKRLRIEFSKPVKLADVERLLGVVRVKADHDGAKRLPPSDKNQPMAVTIKPPTRQRLANELAQRLQLHGLKRRNPKLARNEHDSDWCLLATWTNSSGTFDIYAFFGDFLGKGDVAWVGFGSPQVNTIDQVAGAFGDDEITRFTLADWDIMWDPASDLHRALSSPDNIAIEDYRNEDDFVWIGRYMPRDGDALARSQQFILDVLKQLDPIVFSDENELAWVGPVDREATVKVRIAQNAFRKKLEVRWGGRCAVTGSMLKETLRASHIVSWADGSSSEKTSPDNGLLLTASLDALFDRGYISFGDAGEIIISTMLSSEEMQTHNLHEGLRLRTPPTEKQKAYLRRHQKKHAKRLTGNLDLKRSLRDPRRSSAMSA